MSGPFSDFCSIITKQTELILPPNQKINKMKKAIIIYLLMLAVMSIIWIGCKSENKKTDDDIEIVEEDVNQDVEEMKNDDEMEDDEGDEMEDDEDDEEMD